MIFPHFHIDPKLLPKAGLKYLPRVSKRLTKPFIYLCGLDRVKADAAGKTESLGLQLLDPGKFLMLFPSL